MGTGAATCCKSERGKYSIKEKSVPGYRAQVAPAKFVQNALKTEQFFQITNTYTGKPDPTKPTTKPTEPTEPSEPTPSDSTPSEPQPANPTEPILPTSVPIRPTTVNPWTPVPTSTKYVLKPGEDVQHITQMPSIPLTGEQGLPPATWYLLGAAALALLILRKKLG